MKERKPSLEELKQKMDECERIYHESCKGNSCVDIMNSYRAWKDDKKLYQLSMERLFPGSTKNKDDDNDSLNQAFNVY